MSLNTIELKPIMIADLFGDALIETEARPAAPSEKVKFLGKNAKKIIVVVSNDAAPFLPDEELSFLTNILSACRLSLADIALVNFKNSGEQELQQLIQSSGEKIFLFGIDPLTIGLPINFPQFQLQSFDKRIYLYAPGLPELEREKPLKTRLWTSLKSIFQL